LEEKYVNVIYCEEFNTALVIDFVLKFKLFISVLYPSSFLLVYK